MAKKKKAEKEETEVIRLLFVGARAEGRWPKLKKNWAWRQITEEMNDGSPLPPPDESAPNAPGRERWYTKARNICIGATPGTIIEIEQVVGTSTIYPGTSRIVGRWNCEDDVVEWCAAQRAVEGEIEAGQKVAQEIRQDLPAEALEPFRQAYHGCRNRRAKSQLLAWVVEIITRPG
jgi:hypothetical protein